MERPLFPELDEKSIENSTEKDLTEIAPEKW